MKIIHTSDLHLGQIIYQQYDREREHQHFFAQLQNWCKQEKPDALCISGDVYDIAQPSASSRRFFTEQFVLLHNACPDMRIVLIAGNHDSASRLEAEKELWKMANVTVVGQSPANDILERDEDWQERFIVRLAQTGYIVAMPFAYGDKQTLIQSILDYVARENAAGLPVVMMAHQSVTGSSPVGTETGNLKDLDLQSFGQGYDYLALGHIHRPHTIGDSSTEDYTEAKEYASPVARYSGSALHVSADERFPHSVSVVDMDRREGRVTLKQLRIDEYYHFYDLPETEAGMTSIEEIRQAVSTFCENPDKRGYFRLKIDANAIIEDDVDKAVEAIIGEQYKEDKRFNPRPLFVGERKEAEHSRKPMVFDIAELQQMTDPLAFIEKTRNRYPDLDFTQLNDDFLRVQEEITLMREEIRNAEEEKKQKKKKPTDTVSETIEEGLA